MGLVMKLVLHVCKSTLDDMKKYNYYIILFSVFVKWEVRAGKSNCYNYRNKN
jgi:hypothetical protein